MEIPNVIHDLKPTGMPSGMILDQLVKTMEGMKKTGDQVLKIAINGPLAMLRGKLETLEAEKCLAFENFSRWEYHSYLTSILYSTSSIVGGAILYYLRDEKGSDFIKSGLLMLGSTLLFQENRWNRLARAMSLGNQTVEGVLSIALPLAVPLFTLAWNTRSLFSTQTLGEEDRWTSIYQITKMIIVAIQVGNTYATFSMRRAQLQFDDIGSQMTVLDKQVTELTRMKTQNSKMFKSIENAFKQIVRGVINMTSEMAKN